MVDLLALNWFAIFVATILAFVLGGLWYGPLFGKAWLSAIGKTEEELEPSPAPFVISFFTSLITAVVLAWLISALALTGLVAGLAIGAITGVGFIATAMASDTAFCGWGLKLFLIQSGYRVTYSVLMGGILGVWQ